MIDDFYLSFNSALTTTLSKLSSLLLFSCPTGWVATEEGSCTDDNECLSEPCNNGGTCINFDNGQGFLCMCPTGYGGEICSSPLQEKMILVAKGAYYVIAFVFVNVIGKTLYHNETTALSCPFFHYFIHLSRLRYHDYVINPNLCDPTIPEYTYFANLLLTIIYFPF